MFEMFSKIFGAIAALASSAENAAMALERTSLTLVSEDTDKAKLAADIAAATEIKSLLRSSR